MTVIEMECYEALKALRHAECWCDQLFGEHSPGCALAQIAFRRLEVIDNLDHHPDRLLDEAEAALG
jgi:hypothetical protein